MTLRPRRLFAVAVTLAVLLCDVVAMRTAFFDSEPYLAASWFEHPSSDISAEDLLRHASGGCLATIVRLEEQNDLPVDGDHWVKAWLRPIQSSGTVPDYLYLVVQHGGVSETSDGAPVEEWPSVLRHDSLRVGERHWLVFSEDYDSAKYPPKVGGWWPYREGTVPRQVIEAIERDRFANHPVWDATLNVVYEARQSETEDEVWIRVCEADSIEESGVIFEKTIPGRLQSLQLMHHPYAYEMDWPDDPSMHVVSVATIGRLAATNFYNLAPGTYRINYAFDLNTGRNLAVWVAKNQEIWFMHAFQQYDRDSGETTIDMRFELRPSGGLQAGGGSENWYRRVVRRYQSGELKAEQVFRHPFIKTGKERIYSSSGWIPIAGESL